MRHTCQWVPRVMSQKGTVFQISGDTTVEEVPKSCPRHTREEPDVGLRRHIGGIEGEARRQPRPGADERRSDLVRDGGISQRDQSVQIRKSSTCS